MGVLERVRKPLEFCDAEDESEDCISIVDFLVEFRMSQFDEAEELVEYARRLGVRDMEAAEEIALAYAAYEIEWEEAKRRIEELARRERVGSGPS